MPAQGLLPHGKPGLGRYRQKTCQARGGKGTKGTQTRPVSVTARPTEAFRWDCDGSVPAGSLPRGGAKASASEGGSKARPGWDVRGLGCASGPGKRRSGRDAVSREAGSTGGRGGRKAGAGATPEQSRRPPRARRPALTMATRSQPHHTSGEAGRKCVHGAPPSRARAGTLPGLVAGDVEGRDWKERAEEGGTEGRVRFLLAAARAAGSAAFSGKRKWRAAVREEEVGRSVGRGAPPPPPWRGRLPVGPGRVRPSP